MYIRGCENTNNNNTDREAYREGWKRIFGNKQTEGVTSFPSGKGIYDEETGTWRDSAEMRKGYVPRVLLMKDNPICKDGLEITKQDPKTGRIIKEYEYKKVRF